MATLCKLFLVPSAVPFRDLHKTFQDLQKTFQGRQKYCNQEIEEVMEHNSSSVIKFYCICCVNHELLKVYANCNSPSYILLPYARHWAGNPRILFQ